MSNDNQEESYSSSKMIPVLTVTKNGAILRNIFIVNNKSDSHDEETEEILIVGRHPDCNIVLLHPSISRFHFQINSKPSSRQLFVTDLSSVHGTWVSGKKVEPRSRVELKEDDTITVGSSTRVYRLHWIPFSRACDTDNPFVSLSDLDLIKEKEESIGDISVECENQDDVESSSDTRVIFPSSELMAGEIFTPDKQNHTPKSVLLDSFDKKGKLQDFKSPGTCKSSSRNTSSPSIGQNVGTILSLDEKGLSSKSLKQSETATSSGHQIELEDDMMLKKTRESISLQSFSLNNDMFSLGISGSDASVSDPAASSMDSVCCTENTNATSVTAPGDKRRWTMITDTTTLLDKESRKYLQLLEGLRGTHLVIPNMVINELHALKQHGGLFRRTKEADLALEWIEECVMKTKRWIHVQSSEKTLSSIAPTPPASPVSKFREESWQLPFGNSFEIISPSAEDHILDSALFCKEMINDGKLIILSNNVTLMIKAMAEGLICETAKDFRQSLVNPFSKRFLWADSTPRGRTWTVFDDVELKDRYYWSPTKKSSKEGSAKGLKLLQLRNCQSGQLIKAM